jgi:hypothetical protein
MATSASESDTPPVEVGEPGLVMCALSDVVVAPALVVVVPFVMVGVPVVGPLVVTVGTVVVGDARAVQAVAAGAVAAQAPVADGDPTATGLLKVPVLVAVVGTVAVTNDKVEVVDVTELAVLKVPAVVLSFDTIPSTVTTTRVQGVIWEVVVTVVSVDIVVVVLVMVVVDAESAFRVYCCWRTGYFPKLQLPLLPASV